MESKGLITWQSEIFDFSIKWKMTFSDIFHWIGILLVFDLPLRDFFVCLGFLWCVGFPGTFYGGLTFCVWVSAISSFKNFCCQFYQNCLFWVIKYPFRGRFFHNCSCIWALQQKILMIKVSEPKMLDWTREIRGFQNLIQNFVGLLFSHFCYFRCKIDSGTKILRLALLQFLP